VYKDEGAIVDTARAVGHIFFEEVVVVDNLLSRKELTSNERFAFLKCQ
jgi:hypothetical protein